MNVPRLRFKDDNGRDFPEWKEKRLAEVAKKITDGTHDTPKPVSNGIPYLTAIHIKDGSIDYGNCYFLPEEEHKKIYKRCNPEKNDLLIVNIGAGTSTCALNTVYYEFSLKNVALIKPNKELIHPEYLAQVQRKNSLKQFNQLTSGGAQPFLSLNEIGKINISLPILQEQTKIANFLTAIDEKISQLTQKHDLLKQYKKGVMQQIFSQKLRFKDDDGREFPEWEIKNLGEVFTEITEKVKNQNIETYSITAGKGFVSQREKFGKDISGKQNSNYICLKPYQFSYNKGNSKTYKYGCVYANFTGKDIAVPNVFISFESKLPIATNYYSKLFEWHYLDKFLKKLISSSARMDGLLNVSKQYFFKINIPYPTYNEQTKIANFLTAIDDKIAHTQTQLSAVKLYKKGLLQQLFV